MKYRLNISPSQKEATLLSNILQFFLIKTSYFLVCAVTEINIYVLCSSDLTSNNVTALEEFTLKHYTQLEEL